MYKRILPIGENFRDSEANSVQSLAEAWIDQKRNLEETGALANFNERLIRRWSIETGIVEKLYSVDRGTTEILIANGLDAALIEHGSTDIPAVELITILNDHRDAAAYVMDYVAQHRGLTAYFIRSVHALLTRSQEFVESVDQFGRLVSTPLRKGEWKQIPNNPRRDDGTIYEYCPPELVEDEIQALISMYQALVDNAAPTVIKAAWLHHRFTQIHPFQDGNGRVARALTALVFVSDGIFPIVVDRDIRADYISALERADDEDLKPLVRMFSALEKKELEEALSLSENSITNAAAQHSGTMRHKLLEALRDKAKDKRQSISEKRRAVIQAGRSIFFESVVPTVENLASEIEAILTDELHGSNVRVEISDDAKRHFFKTQLIAVSQNEGFYSDFETIHEWVRLRLQRPGEDDTDVSEVVISLHSLGRQFTGVLVISAYFATRLLDEFNRSVTLDPKRLSDRSLTFSYREPAENIRERISEWLEDALNMALAEFQKSI